MDTPSAPRASPQDNAVNISGQSTVEVHGDLFGGNKYIGYTAEQVRVLIADIRASYQPRPFDGRSPYVGLASFQEQDADRFFGREKLAQELVARIETARFLVIAGPSGSGKSSLARAGLMHALRKGVQLNALTNVPTSTEHWLYEILTPGRNPLAELARVVSSFTKSLEAGDEIVKRGRADETLLHRWADIALGDQKTRRAILLVDQFEEVFTQVTDESERAAFLNLLVFAATVENGRVTIVVCTRSDFIGNWAAYPNLNAQLSSGVNQIPPMQPDELVSAIARPALQVGLQIDPELVKQILDDMRDAPGALPLMQFALEDLFEYEKNQGGIIALTRDDYLARGGLHQALSRHADAAFAKLNSDEQKIARSVFSSLIEPGRGNVDTRRTARLQEIVPADADAAQVTNVITKLADARLVTTDKKDADETIALAHERLIDAWKWLRDLIDENRAAIALQNQINDDAQEWEEHGRDASYLYAGARLATAQEQVAEKRIALSAVAQEFVGASIAARQAEIKKAQQRTRRLLMAFGVAAAVFAVLAVVALIFQQRAVQSEDDALAARSTAETRQAEAISQKNEAERQQKIARSRELAALAHTKFETAPDLAMLIAIEANRDTNAVTFESEDALREILFEYPLLTTLRRNQESMISEVGSVQYSSDGTRIVTASDDGVVQVWDAATGQELVRLRGHTAPVNSAQFSRDGTRIVTASEDGTSRVWDTVSGKEMSVLRGHMGAVVDAQFSPDDKWILTIGCEKADERGDCTFGTARLWDGASSLATNMGKQLAVMNGKNVFTTAKFSPDGWQNGIQIVTTECESSTPTQPNEIPSCYSRAARVWNLIPSAGTADVKEIANFYPDRLGVIHTQFVSNDASNRVMAVTNDSDGKVQVWDAVSGKEISALRGIEYDITSVEISPNGTKIITASSAGVENTARVWNIADGELIDTLAHVYQINSVHFSPDGEKIVTASSGDQTARVWRVADLSNRQDNKKPLILNAQDYVTSIEFSFDSTQIITTGPNRGVQVWDANGGKELAVLRGHSKSVNDAKFSPDGKKIVTAGCDTLESLKPCEIGTTRLWGSNSGREIAVLSGKAHDVLSVDFTEDGSKLVTNECSEVYGFSCLASTARVWDVTSGKLLATLHTQKKLVLTARFSSDGKQIVTIECDDDKSPYCIDGTARLWDAANGALHGSVGENIPLSNAAFSPNGMWLVTTGCDTFDPKSCTAGSAHVWEISTLRETGSVREHTVLRGHADWVRDAEFSPDSSRIITGSRDGTARVWDVANGKELVTLRGDALGAISAQFSQDGTRILTTNHGLRDKTVRVWDASNGTPITVLSGFANGIISARLSPDGTKIVTVNVDRTVDTDYFVQVWDAASGVRLALLRGHGSRVNSAQFSPDGTKIVTASDDGTARVYLVNVKDLIELAKQRVGRELDCQERENYLRQENSCPISTPEVTPTP